MFCPNCGIQEREPSQFCRSCGIDMRSVRTGIEIATTGMAPARTAREDIGRAVAAKIGDLKSAKDLKRVVDEVLPEIEKFLETPEERRLRRMRIGTITSAIGLGAAVFAVLMYVQDPDVLPLAAMGVITFLIGIGVLINGHFHTLQRAPAQEEAERARLRNLLDRPSDMSGHVSGAMDRLLTPPPSVVEHTTRQLPDEPPVPRSRATAE